MTSETWRPARDPVADRLATARQLAAAGGALALDYFRRRPELLVDTKSSPQDLVSQADREVETLIRDGIAAAWPDDGQLGEEHGWTPGRSGFTWVIDPIDGTQPFLAGLPHWCVVIALVGPTGTAAGVIAVPMADETFEARAGYGAFLNGRRLRLAAVPGLDHALVAIGANNRADPAVVGGAIRRLLEAGGMYYRNGSGALMLASAACGRLSGYFEPYMHPWDCLAGLLLVTEAGGDCAPFPALGKDGQPLGGSVLATAPGLLAPLRALVEAPD